MRQLTNLILAGVATAALGVATASADHLNIDVSGVKQMGAKVTFKAVKIDKPGFLVIHATKDGNPVIPQSVGHTWVKPGVTEGVAVTLATAPKDGETFIAMLHEDTNNNGKYEFGVGSTDVDTPALNAEKKPYVKAFKAGM